MFRRVIQRVVASRLFWAGFSLIVFYGALLSLTCLLEPNQVGKTALVMVFAIGALCAGGTILVVLLVAAFAAVQALANVLKRVRHRDS